MILVDFSDGNRLKLIMRDSKSGIKYVLEYYKIVEFIDKNGDGFPSDGEILHNFYLNTTWNISFGKLQAESPEGTVDFGVMITVANMEDGYDSPQITIYYYVFTNDTKLRDYPVYGEREVKIDFTIKYWPWNNESSRLALYANLYTIPESGVARFECDEEELDGLTIYKVKVISSSNEWVEFGSSNICYMLTGLPQPVACKTERRLGDVLAEIIFSYPHFMASLLHDHSILGTYIPTVVEEVTRVINVLILPLLVIFIAVVVVLVRKILKRRAPRSVS